MKVLGKLLKKSKKDLCAAASAIAALESKLAKKEIEANDLREALKELYKTSVLGKKIPAKKIGKIKAGLEEKQAEVEGLKSVIEAAKTEAVSLAEMEIEDRLAIKTKLQKQMKEETVEENTKIIASMQELIVAIYRVYGIRGAISKDFTRFNISTSTVPDADLLKANQDLEVLFNSTITGPHIISEQIKKIEEQTAKADPKKSVECALKDARSSSNRSVSKKAA